ncbi:UNVERIFIED_CONTAM: Auxin-induced protein X10A [Sesamum radiatum]|uniref:Auxin-induced protein X10A n=1 Tax=Sesamum radiatum TaxID=300843 RepID=A0AAW2RXA6_SESRA
MGADEYYWKIPSAAINDDDDLDQGGWKNKIKKKKKKTPRGHIVVYVGEEMRRFFVPISCLKNAQFQELLQQSADVYGFDHGQGGILLPCTLPTFLRVMINFKPPSHHLDEVGKKFLTWPNQINHRESVSHLLYFPT